MPAAGILTLALVSAAEIWARSVVPESARARGFPNEEIELKTRQLKTISRDGGRIDVLLVGSSPVHYGIDTTSFAKAASAVGRVQAYNAGVSGPSFAGIKVILDKFYLPYCDPQVILICLTPNDLNAGSPIVVRATREMVDLAAQEIPQFLYAARIFDQRRRIGRFLTTLGERPLKRPEERHFDRGYEDFSARAAGRGRWDAAGRLQNLRVDGAAFDALAAFVNEHRTKERTCVLVNLPMREDFREYVTTGEYTGYVEALRALARRSDMLFVDLMDAGVVEQSAAEKGAAGFGDIVHLKAAGASKIATWLGTYYHEHVAGKALADRRDSVGAALGEQSGAGE